MYVCLSTQRLIALAKGKMSMVKMNMRRENDGRALRQPCCLSILRLSSITTIAVVEVVKHEEVKWWRDAIHVKAVSAFWLKESLLRNDWKQLRSEITERMRGTSR